MTRSRQETAGGDALWRFSLALYARPGVADALIALQDRHGLDVNLILYALWLGVHGIGLDDAALAAAAAVIAPITTAAVAPLRRLRRELRGADDSQLRLLGRRILGLELAAERQVQSRLAKALPPGKAGPEASPLGTAAANLDLYLGGARAPPETAVLLEALEGLTRRH